MGGAGVGGGVGGVGVSGDWAGVCAGLGQGWGWCRWV